MKQNTFRTHFIYWILPTLVTLVCILIYFYDFFSASEIVSCAFDREFGILENLQLLVILITAFIAARGARLKKIKLEKYIFYSIAVAVLVFFFLEEIDYGLQFYEFITDNKVYTQYGSEKIRNIHSNGKNTNILKLVSYGIIVLFFVLLPMLGAFRKNNSPFLQYITPTVYIIYPVISLFLLNQFAFYLYEQDFHTNRSLDGNVSEFEELMFYYIILLYITEMTSINKQLSFIRSRSDKMKKEQNG